MSKYFSPVIALTVVLTWACSKDEALPKNPPLEVTYTRTRGSTKAGYPVTIFKFEVKTRPKYRVTSGYRVNKLESKRGPDFAADAQGRGSFEITPSWEGDLTVTIHSTNPAHAGVSTTKEIAIKNRPDTLDFDPVSEATHGARCSWKVARKDTVWYLGPVDDSPFAKKKKKDRGYLVDVASQTLKLQVKAPQLDALILAGKRYPLGKGKVAQVSVPLKSMLATMELKKLASGKVPIPFSVVRGKETIPGVMECELNLANQLVFRGFTLPGEPPAPRKARFILTYEKGRYGGIGRGKTLKDVDLLATINSWSRKVAPCRFASASSTATVPRICWDINIMVKDRRTAKKIAEKSFRAKPPKCDKKVRVRLRRGEHGRFRGTAISSTADRDAAMAWLRTFLAK